MKFGLNQIGKPAPLWLSNIASALVILLGGLAVWSLSIPETIMTAENKNWLGGSFTFAVSIVEVIKVLTGKNQKNDADN